MLLCPLIDKAKGRIMMITIMEGLPVLTFGSLLTGIGANSSLSLSSDRSALLWRCRQRARMDFRTLAYTAKCDGLARSAGA